MNAWQEELRKFSANQIPTKEWVIITCTTDMVLKLIPYTLKTVYKDMGHLKLPKWNEYSL